jgi:hypothetical protein
MSIMGPVRGRRVFLVWKNDITWLVYFLELHHTNKDKYIGLPFSGFVVRLSNIRSQSSSEWVIHMFTLAFVFS